MPKKAALLAFLLATPTLADIPLMDIQGAEGRAKGSVTEVTKDAREVFKQLNITPTASSSSDSGRQATLEGSRGNLDVTVQLDRMEKDETKVGVVAKRGGMNWDKNTAQDVLAKIVQKG